jgi:UDP-N-acetylglucosamine--N-acetylmuramyl-(pentapeptide) pyrophosphoryl-undecaprenol N-acetylglucosamine transferase
VYRSFWNFIDLFKTAFGVAKALVILFRIFPDVVFSKGGYVSVPTVFAARILRIPIFIHDSDAVPGRANLWAGKFAKRIAIAYPEAAEYFEHKDRVANIGNPVRKELLTVARHGTHEYLGFDREIPTLLVIGGSSGAEAINRVVLDSLSELVEKYQIVHQTGKTHYEMVSGTADVILSNSPHYGRYKAFSYLNDLALRMASGAADLIISRAGSNSIFEIATWEKPSIIIPIPEEISRDQRRNAFAYARTGAAAVIEQANLTPHVLMAEIERILGDQALLKEMTEATTRFKRPDAARKLAEEILSVALEHEE